MCTLRPLMIVVCVYVSCIDTVVAIPSDAVAWAEYKLDLQCSGIWLRKELPTKLIQKVHTIDSIYLTTATSHFTAHLVQYHSSCFCPCPLPFSTLIFLLKSSFSPLSLVCFSCLDSSPFSALVTQCFLIMAAPFSAITNVAAYVKREKG